MAYKKGFFFDAKYVLLANLKLIIRKPLFQFIHIPKNAGTSIKRHIVENKFKDIHLLDHRCINYLRKIPTIVCLRDPIARFKSAFYYRVNREKSQFIRDWLAQKSIVDHRDFINYLIDTNDFHNPLISWKANKEEPQKVWNKEVKLCYGFEPQTFWLKEKPKVVFLTKELSKEWDFFCNKYEIPLKNLPTKNSSKIYTQSNNTLSESQIKFLKKMYLNDFTTYEEFKNISFEERI